MISIIDYGSGNLRSVQKGFEKVGFPARVTDDPKKILESSGVVLPGVGAFADCMAGLASRGLVPVVKDWIASGKPFLGICVGLQLLFDESEEGGRHAGLGIIRGKVRRFPHADASMKIPQMGWNQIDFTHNAAQGCEILSGISSGSFVYFVHSYYCEPEEDSVVMASTDYIVRFAAAVKKGNVYATQFHPEKSQAVGLRILRNFGKLVIKND